MVMVGNMVVMVVIVMVWLMCACVRGGVSSKIASMPANHLEKVDIASASS